MFELIQAYNYYAREVVCMCVYLVNRCIDQRRSVQVDLSLALGTLQGIPQICLCPE